jgi:predicted RNase H-like HicB family nuclease
MKAYRVEVRLSKQEDGLWRAEIPLMPGSFVDAPTIHEALNEIQEVAAMFIDLLEEEGRTVLRPISPAADESLDAILPVIVEEYAIRRPGRRSRRSASAS